MILCLNSNFTHDRILQKVKLTLKLSACFISHLLTFLKILRLRLCLNSPRMEWDSVCIRVDSGNEFMIN